MKIFENFTRIYTVVVIILLNILGISLMSYSLLNENFNVPAGDIFLAFLSGTIVWIICNLCFLIPLLFLVGAYCFSSLIVAISPIIVIIAWIAELLGSTTGIRDYTILQQLLTIPLSMFGIFNLYIIYSLYENN